MRQGHLLAVYLLLFLVCFVRIHMEQIQYDKVMKEKQRVEDGLKNAVDAAAQRFIESQYENEEYRKNAVIDVFFDSLYLYLGVHSQREEQKQLQMHIPMIVLAQEDGVCFYYGTETEENGTVLLEYGWEEKIPYNTKEEERVTKEVVADVIEKKASQIISQYNVIASQMGINYEFFVPRFLGNTATSLEFPMIFVVFQGWPLTASGNISYDNCIDAGASIHKKNKYVVEVPNNLSNTYSYFHLPECSELGAKGRVLEGQWFSREEAMKQYGAVPCTKCGK